VFWDYKFTRFSKKSSYDREVPVAGTEVSLFKNFLL
jgi:hypothetical protein